MSWIWVAGAAAVVLLGLVSRMGEKSGSVRNSSSSTPPSPELIDQLLRSGHKIDAIKAYRTLHGVDLKAAKDAIDARARELGR